MIENKWESKLIEKSSNVAISKSGGKKTNFGVIPYGIGLFLPKHPSMIIKKLIKIKQYIDWLHLPPKATTYKNPIAILNSKWSGKLASERVLRHMNSSANLGSHGACTKSFPSPFSRQSSRELTLSLLVHPLKWNETQSSKVKPKCKSVAPRPLFGWGVQCLYHLKCGVCAFCTQRLHGVGGPLPFSGRECKQIPKETAWLSDLGACCDWPGLKEFSKLHLCQGKCKRFPETGIEGEGLICEPKQEEQGGQNIKEIGEAP